MIAEVVALLAQAVERSMAGQTAAEQRLAEMERELVYLRKRMDEAESRVAQLELDDAAEEEMGG